ncbi:MAG TPA: vitamin K epoxide reductase family protein [Chthonomonadales bacterium]|nr:vitamin K epoxide reductase family protein [Chthonomonadales bacterium]
MRPKLANRLVFVFALLGAGISAYLTLAHLNPALLVCGPVLQGCDRVAAHATARGFGIAGLEAVPTAVFGLLMYLWMATLSFVRVAAAALDRPARLLQGATAVLAVGASAWLTYMEAFVIQAWCQWCVMSAVLTVLILLAIALEKPEPVGVPAESQT